MDKNKSPSSAEKRVLWEMRQRYDKPERSSRRRTPARAAGSPPQGPRQPLSPVGGGRSRKRGKRKVSWVRRMLLIFVLLVVLSGGVFGYRILAASNKISTTERSVIGQLKDLLFSQGNVLHGETEDRVNLLIIAIGGEGHKGQNLADTIMVASIRPSDNNVALLSIPRDLYVQVPGEEYYSKINAVHAYGESQKTDQGPEALRQTVEEITGLPIHYYGRVDFTAFKEIIDSVGGINVTIDNTFFDYWHKISFSAGTEQMDGERALAYARARYVEGPEGGDFKRAARQQEILLALREKVFSVNTALDFSASRDILNALSDNIRTDLELWEMKRFYEMARQIDSSQVQSVVLSSGSSGVLVGTTEVLGGTPASVLKPRTGDYSEIQELSTNLFAVATSAPAVPDATAEPTPEIVEAAVEVPKPSVEIRNGTTETGLAKKNSDQLTDEGYEVTGIGNAATKDYTATVVYVLDEEFSDGAQALADELSARLEVGLPAEEAATEAQTLIILGEDAVS